MKSEELQIPVGYDACVALRVEKKIRTSFQLTSVTQNFWTQKRATPLEERIFHFFFSSSSSPTLPSLES